MTTRTKYLRGAVVLGLLAIFAFVTPARAGVGPSTGCSDGPFTAPGTELPILTSPITLAAEVGRLTSTPYIRVCFSTTSTGNGNAAIVGGSVQVDFNPTNRGVGCDPDDSPVVIGVDCEVDANTVWVNLILQGSPIEIGIGYAFLDDVVCLRNVVVTTPTGSTPELDIGACV